jgi:hypothetical protein
MTDPLALVRELHALERLSAVIAAQAARQPEWDYAIVALAERISVLRCGLQQVDATVLAGARAAYELERRSEPAPASGTPLLLPPGGLVH